LSRGLYPIITKEHTAEPCMLFSSITFIVCFLPVVLLLYYYCPAVKTRNNLLLLASLIFYAWGEPVYVILMLFSIMINYRTGTLLGKTKYANSTRRCILAMGILINLFLLFYFKYFVFSERIINKILRISNHPQFQLTLLNIALPLGISFYTFQSISYLADVYKNPALIQKNIVNLGLYISFFPQLIAGPIVRYHDINEQIKERSHSINSFVSGIERFIIGLSKKVLIANVMAIEADRILGLSPDSVPFYYLIFGIICYTFQIYYDFSGYSDMAIGLGKMFGFTILENFNYPYVSKTITEFWRRWHISLSNWFRDYLYIPLGGNRKGKIRTIINLFIVFFTTGLWHGAAGNFVIWGLGHGLLLFVEKLFGNKIGSTIKNKRLKNILGHLYTMVFVIVLWAFFRLGTKESLNFLEKVFTLNHGDENTILYVKSMIDVQFMVYFVAAMLFSFPWDKKSIIVRRLNFTPLRYGALIALLILSISSLASNSYNPFIYFRF
jgi:alginate O-acetyltransferase complex protein AlgI